MNLWSVHYILLISVEILAYLTNMWSLSHAAILPPHHPGCFQPSAEWIRKPGLHQCAHIIQTCFWIISFVKVNCRKAPDQTFKRCIQTWPPRPVMTVCSWHRCLSSCRPLGVSVAPCRLSSSSRPSHMQTRRWSLSSILSHLISQNQRSHSRLWRVIACSSVSVASVSCF